MCLKFAPAAEAALMASGDMDLLVLDPWRNVHFVPPAFIRLWTQASA